LEIKRPGTGIQPKFLDKILGKITSKDIEEDLPITWDDLD
jgi:sialic acid synthase SpsE